MVNRSPLEQLAGAEGSGARRSPAMSDGGSGYPRGSGYRMKTTMWLRGERPGAHGDHVEQASGLGEGPERAEQRGGSPAAGDGNKDGGIDAELPGSPGSLRT